MGSQSGRKVLLLIGLSFHTRLSILSICYYCRERPYCTLAVYNLDEDPFAVRQVLDFAAELLALSPREHIFACDAIQLIVLECTDEAGREELDWRGGSGDEVMIDCLHADDVHEALASDTIVGFQDVVKVVDGVIGVACG